MKESTTYSAIQFEGSEEFKNITFKNVTVRGSGYSRRQARGFVSIE